MTLLPVRQEVIRFRDLIAELLGLHFEESKLGQLAKLLQQRAQAQDKDCGSYLRDLAAARPDTDEAWCLAGELTVTETYFLRNPDQFKACVEVALPQRLAASSEDRKVRILCAGCASGDEPYTLAILACEHFAHALHRISITALDVNGAMLEKAQRACYTQWALRDFPAPLRARWFQAQGDAFILDKGVRGLVDFNQHNLAQAAPTLWQPASWDLVFCRNVLMYFTPEQARTLIDRVAQALVPGGYFFLGHAETLRGLSNDFHLCHTHGTFYYQRKDTPTVRQGASWAWEPEPEQRRRPGTAVGDGAWVAEIQRATDRIQALSIPLAARVQAVQADHGVSRTPLVQHLHRALEYLHMEQYEQTLELLNALPGEQALDPDVLLLKAVSLTHRGDLDAADACCRTLLERDEFSAGAHYVRALCCEGVGDLAQAVEHDQTAIYLDPGFAMPCVHLGLMARRQGDLSTARRELGRAVLLLQKEDSSRLLLFGGGFKRETLVALCQAELTKLGGGT